MAEMFSKKRLERLLDQFIQGLMANADLGSCKREYEQQLTDCLSDLIVHEVKLETFLALAMGFNWWDKLCSTSKTKPGNCINGGGLLDTSDYQQSSEDLLSEYDSCLDLLSYDQTAKSTCKKTFIDWLRLAESKNLELNSNFTTPILCSYFNIAEEIGKNKRPVISTLNLSQLAKRLNMNNPRDALIFCINQPEVGVYIQCRIKGLNYIDTSDSTNILQNCVMAPGLVQPSTRIVRKITDIEMAFENKKIIKCYPYNYTGYVRLKVDPNTAWLEQTVNYLQQGSTIKIKTHKSHKSLSTQLSVYQYLIGANEYLDNLTREEVEITLDDLVFMEDELANVNNQGVATGEELLTLANGENQFIQLLNRDDIAKAAVLKNGKAEENSIDKNALPNKKVNELHEILNTVYQALREKNGKNPKNDEVWNELKSNKNQYDQEKLIKNITMNKINWTSSYANERTMCRRTFQNKAWLKK